jgi:hypothetical protein
MIRRVLGLMGLGTAFLVACSSSTSGGGVASTPEDACDQYVSTFCNKISECFPAAIRLSYKDAAECISRQKTQCVKSLNAPSTAATPAYVSGCASAISAASCDDVFKQPDACKTPAGTLADGTPCGDDAQCTGRTCNKTGDTNCGACGQRVAAGGDCTKGKCDDGLSCAENGKCVAPGAAGATCGENQPCLTPLVCANGTCAKGGEAGAACSEAAPCNAFKALACDSASKTCKEVKLANPGETCGVVNGAFVLCAAGGDCKTAGATSPTGTCQAALADGAACTTDGPSCQEPAECVNGVCTVSDPGTCK